MGLCTLVKLYLSSSNLHQSIMWDMRYFLSNNCSGHCNWWAMNIIIHIRSGLAAQWPTPLWLISSCIYGISYLSLCVNIMERFYIGPGLISFLLNNKSNMHVLPYSYVVSNYTNEGLSYVWSIVVTIPTSNQSDFRYNPLNKIWTCKHWPFPYVWF